MVVTALTAALGIYIRGATLSPTSARTVPIQLHSRPTYFGVAVSIHSFYRLATREMSAVKKVMGEDQNVKCNVHVMVARWWTVSLLLVVIAHTIGLNDRNSSVALPPTLMVVIALTAALDVYTRRATLPPTSARTAPVLSYFHPIHPTSFAVAFSMHSFYRRATREMSASKKLMG